MVSNMNLTNICKDIGVKQNIPLQKKKRLFVRNQNLYMTIVVILQILFKNLNKMCQKEQNNHNRIV